MVQMGSLIKLLLVAVVAVVLLPVFAGQLGTARLNQSIIDTGLQPFMIVIGIVFIAVILLALSRHLGHSD